MTTPESKKRTAPLNGETPPPKSAKLNPANLIDCAKVPSSHLAMMPMLSIKATPPIQLKFMIQEKVVIMNEGAQEVSWGRGALVCAFGKGKFMAKTGDDSAEDIEKWIHYKLDSCNTEVLLHGGLKPLKDVIEERKKTHANPKIMYYTMGDNPEDPNAFILEKSHDVYFSPVNPMVTAEEDKEKAEEDNKKNAALQASAGALIKPAAWETHSTTVAWSVEWKPNKGLMPIRPQVVFKSPGTLQGGRALQLWNSEGA